MVGWGMGRRLSLKVVEEHLIALGRRSVVGPGEVGSVAGCLAR